MHAHLISATGQFVARVPIAQFQPPRILVFQDTQYVLDPMLGDHCWGGDHEPPYGATDRAWRPYLEAPAVAVKEAGD